MKYKIFIACITLLALICGAAAFSTKDSEAISIGVISPLTGDVAYWGESARAGWNLAVKDLSSEGIKVNIIAEDGGLDPAKALSAAQKLVNIDGVKALYVEFNPASISVSSFLKDKEVVEIYDATPVSPLALSGNFFKTYLNYKESCATAAEVLKERGFARIGMLKMNLEHGDLCVKGVASVFGDGVMVEPYNQGTTDFRTALSKLAAAKAEVVFHSSFQPETLISLEQMRTLGMKQQFVALSETFTPDVASDKKRLIEGAITFGLPSVSPELVARMSAGGAIVDENAAALAYLHVMQLGRALYSCDSDITCVRDRLASSPAFPEAGFQGFFARVARFDTLLGEWSDGSFKEIVR
ncbi:MAG TPA: ABC transporter substrate-binding protein [Candidatus Paceibacterota bacterium]